MRAELSAAERDAVNQAIAAGRVTVIDRPPPMDPDEVARRYARKPSPRRPFKNAPVPQDMLDEIKSMDGLYSRQEIADRLEIDVSTVKRVLGTGKPGKINLRRVTDEIRDGVIALRGKATIPDIAQKFGIGQATVSRLFRGAGLVRVRKPRPKAEPKLDENGKRVGDYVRKLTPEDRQKIIEARGSGPLTEIAARFGVSHSTISKIYLDAGLVGTPTGRRRAPKVNEIHPEEEAAILALRGTMSGTAIAKRFGRAGTSIRKLFARTDRRRAEVAAAVRTRTPPGDVG